MKTLFSILLCFFICEFNAQTTQATFYVSPTGNDNNAGTITQPFATITKARDVVRTINTNMTGDIVIYLREGRYQQTNTIIFSTLDKGTNGYNIIYQAYRCETPVISGGFNITGWTLHDASKNIYKATVPAGTDTRQLYVNGKRTIRARSIDATGWVQTTDGYTCPPNVATWSNIENVEVVAFWNWQCSRGPIGSISDTNVTMSNPYWSNLKSGFSGTGFPVWIENAYELLDNEGEWYLNKTTATLYYKPKLGEDINTAEVIFPKLEVLITATNLSNVIFKGITFRDATWLIPNTTGFDCAQGDVYDNNAFFVLSKNVQMPGNIKFEYSNNIKFENNRFEHLGATGLQIAVGCKNNVVYNNTFQDISGSGISIGDLTNCCNPTAIDLVKDNTIDNNLIRNVAQEFKASLGIFVTITEHTVITHNEIRNLPYSGMSVGWGWSNTILAGKNNDISYNLIDSTNTVLIDGGGIYTLSKQTGAQVHHNYIKNHFKDYGGLYLDQGTSDMHWHHNVLSNIVKWELINTDAQNNLIDSNYFDNNQKIEVTPVANNTHNNNTFINDENWPAEAQDIMKNAGRIGVSTPITFNAINVALNKPTNRSSTYNSGTESNLGNDGNIGSIWASEGTSTDKNPWWQVDLGTAYKIAKIDLFARKDLADAPELRTNFEIQASNTNDFSTYDVLGSNTGVGTITYAVWAQGNNFPAYGVWGATISNPISYRYIRVQRINDAGFFVFSEIKVYENLPPEPNYSVQKICINPTQLELNVSNTSQLTYSILPSYAANQNVSWSSTDVNIATVDGSGLVTAKAAGNTKIIVTTNDSGKTDTCFVTVNLSTDIKENYKSDNFSIYPNPANQFSIVNYQLNENSTVKIVVCDVLGKEVMQVVNEKQNAGEHQFNINTTQLQNGIYFVNVNNEQKNRKLIITK